MPSKEAEYDFKDKLKRTLYGTAMKPTTIDDVERGLESLNQLESREKAKLRALEMGEHSGAPAMREQCDIRLKGIR